MIDTQSRRRSLQHMRQRAGSKRVLVFSFVLFCLGTRLYSSIIDRGSLTCMVMNLTAIDTSRVAKDTFLDVLGWHAHCCDSKLVHKQCC
jgi:hypothetical protein